MNPIIKIENISKQYRLGDVGTGTLSHDLNRWWAKMLGKEDPFLKIGETNDQKTKGESDYVWALKDINIEVMPGEVLGIIGKNGAGKSTLLKLLSRVTAPTTGSIKARGRIASLLEVGTGFHPELTGRENIFLNGAILGMTKAEIRSKFEEIVDFAGVERYIDTPVKRYSSGMYVRLAFAVAAHLESEILIVDEVLAVGDAEFQKKCLGKMDDVAKNLGRTILFVSHNMAAVRDLCNQCILIDKGAKLYEGDTETTLLKYNSTLRNIQLKANKGEYNSKRRGSGTLSFTNIEILSTCNERRNVFAPNEIVRFRLSYEIFAKIIGLQTSISLFSSVTKEFLTNIKHVITENTLNSGDKGTVLIDLNLQGMRHGEYSLYFWLSDKRNNGMNNDIVDDITEPLIIKASSEEEKTQSGYFSLSSSIIRVN